MVRAAWVSRPPPLRRLTERGGGGAGQRPALPHRVSKRAVSRAARGRRLGRGGRGGPSPHTDGRAGGRAAQTG